MSNLTPKIIRLALDQTATTSVLDALTLLRPVLWRGEPANLECCLFNGVPSADTLIDVSNVSAVETILRKHNAFGTTLVDKTQTGPFTTSCTYAQWLARSAEHFTVQLAAAELLWAVPDSGSLPLYLAIQPTNSVGATSVVAGYGTLIDRGTSDVVAPPLPSSYVPLALSVDGVTNVALFQSQAVVDIVAAAGVGEYLYVVTLPETDDVFVGALIDMAIEIAASANPTINVRTGSTIGTLIHAVNGDPDNSTYQHITFRFGADRHWKKFGPEVS